MKERDIQATQMRRVQSRNFMVRLIVSGRVRGQLQDKVKLFGSEWDYADKLGLNYCRSCFDLKHSTYRCCKRNVLCFSCGNDTHNGRCSEEPKCVRCGSRQHTSEQIDHCPEGRLAVALKASNFRNHFPKIFLERKDYMVRSQQS